jgi:nucleotide-binding universal stress UspA family protein
MNSTSIYQRILVATDFSPCSDAALRQAIWWAGKSGGSLTLVHVLPNIRHLVESASYQARVDFLYAEGNEFRKEVQEVSESRLKTLASKIAEHGISVSYKTLLGAPYAEITRLVMEQSNDLVLMGTHGMSGWKQFLLGSTSQRLIRTCPAPVWVVKAEHVEPPKIVLAATDFSEVSRRAAREALGIARQAAAKLHLVHVIDATEFPAEFLTHLSTAGAIWQEVKEDAQHRFQELITSLGTTQDQVECHIANGAPWHEVARLAADIHAELVVLGTVGRSGLKGVLMGNTAEQVLSVCDCSILAVKPEDFVSPVLPPVVFHQSHNE